mgnify:CR=1 FL=1
MFTKKKTFVEICFTERELDILKEAEKIIKKNSLNESTDEFWSKFDFPSFDEFKEKELLTERDLQDYLGRYQDLRDEWRNRQPKGDKEDIIDDIVFEIELIKQIEINIDYILMLVKKYKDGNCENKEIVVDIRRAVDGGGLLCL